MRTGPGFRLAKPDIAPASGLLRQRQNQQACYENRTLHSFKGHGEANVRP